MRPSTSAGMPFSARFLRMIFLHLGQEGLEFLAARGDSALQIAVGGRLQIAKGQVLEIAADHAHAESMRDGSVDIERLAGDALLLIGAQEFESAHIVQAIGQLDQDDANVGDHGQQHLAHALDLAGFGREQLETADFRDAFDQPRYITAETFGQFGERASACLRPHRAAGRRKA